MKDTRLIIFLLFLPLLSWATITDDCEATDRCMDFTFVGQTDNGDGTSTLCFDLTVNCNKSLSNIAFDLEGNAIAPTNNYTSPSGLNYNVENPTNNPYTGALKFEGGNGVKNGDTEQFCFVVSNDYVAGLTSLRIKAKAGNKSYEVDLNLEDCVDGEDPEDPEDPEDEDCVVEAGCFEYTFVEKTDNGNGNTTFCFDITVNCNRSLSNVAFDVNGNAVSPNNSYTSPGGLVYNVENPTNNPFTGAIKFEGGEGIKNGDTERFCFDIPTDIAEDITEITIQAKAGQNRETATLEFDDCEEPVCIEVPADGGGATGVNGLGINYPATNATVCANTPFVIENVVAPTRTDIEIAWIKCTDPAGACGDVFQTMMDYNVGQLYNDFMQNGGSPQIGTTCWEFVSDGDADDLSLTVDGISGTTCFVRCVRGEGCESFTGEGNIMTISTVACEPELCGNTVSISGLSTANYHAVQVFDATFTPVFDCGSFSGNGPCADPENFDLPDGTYYINADYAADRIIDFQQITLPAACANPLVNNRDGNSTTQAKADRNATSYERRVLGENSNTGLRIFPNPAKDQVNITLTEWAGKAVDIQLFDELGRLVKTIQIDQVEDNTLQIDTNNFAQGVYILSVQSGNESAQIKKLVILND